MKPKMERHFHEELTSFKEKLIRMSHLVEINIDNAIEAVLKRNRLLAAEVFEKEKLINGLEIEIDDIGHSLLALGQPMAIDLRLITTILKMNTDLERLGDHAVNIAERAVELDEAPPIETNLHLVEMTLAVRKMLKDALDAFMQNNLTLADEVLKCDDVVDAYNDSLYTQLQNLMEKDPAVIKTGMRFARIGHDLERIGDLANNIAENVVYLGLGKEVRHHIES